MYTEDIAAFTNAVKQMVSELGGVFASDEMTKMIDSVAALQVRARNALVDGGYTPEQAFFLINGLTDKLAKRN